MLAIQMERLFYLSQDSWSEVTSDGFVSGVVRTSAELRRGGARSRATATALVIGDNPPFLADDSKRIVTGVQSKEN